MRCIYVIEIPGKVVDGKVVVEGDALPEGSDVRVIIPTDDESDELTDEEWAELQEAVAEIERGDFITGEELLAERRRPIPDR
jgi:hypothetical protein